MFKKELIKLLRDKDFMDKNKSFALEIALPGHPVNELIINSSENAEAKAAYIENTYDDDLCNKNNPTVRIVSIKFYAKSIYQILS